MKDIKPQDLRLGNWVKNMFGNPVQVTVIDDTVDYFKPIPITEDILLKMGFKARPHLGDYYIKLHGNAILCDNHKGETYICGSNQQRIILPKLNSVNELQNLYWSLTQKELTYQT